MEKILLPVMQKLGFKVCMRGLWEEEKEERKMESKRGRKGKKGGFLWFLKTSLI